MTAERNTVPVAAPSLSRPALLIGLRAGCWVVAQLLAAGLLLLGTPTTLERSLEEVAGWWMVYGTLVDIATLAVLAALLNRESLAFRDLIGPRTGLLRTVLLGLAVLIATAPAVALTSLINSAWYGDAPPPIFAVIDLPPLAMAHSVLIWPLVAEVTEALVFLAYALPRLEVRLRSRQLAAIIVVVAWSLSAAAYPILLTDAGFDLGFAAYRAVSVLPVLAVWTALYLVLRRRLVPVIIAMWLLNAGTALAIAFDAMGG